MPYFNIFLSKLFTAVKCPIYYANVLYAFAFNFLFCKNIKAFKAEIFMAKREKMSCQKRDNENWAVRLEGRKIISNKCVAKMAGLPKET